MSDQEDLYLKGFMAFNAKDYKAAAVFWEQVLAADPDHVKARQGLEKLQKPSSKGASSTKKKRSSKEVFQEIKRLYAAKNYPEALRLTILLLKKHPDNKDLQGLRQRLESRGMGQDKTAPPAGADSKRSTMFIAVEAEKSVDNAGDTGSKAKQVEKLIQSGVSLYEIQDYDSAISTWNKALALDPTNRIAHDYVENVSALVAAERNENPQEPPPAPPDPAPPDTAPPDPSPPPGKPSKENMLVLYNDAMALYKEHRYHDALDKWNFILSHFPNHAETLQCVSKTKVLLEKEQVFKDRLLEVRANIAAGHLSVAESALMRLAIEAPRLEGCKEVQAELDAARAMSSNDSHSEEVAADFIAEDAAVLDSPPSDDINDNRGDHSATDDEITSYFNDEPESGPRRVATVTVIKKKVKHPYLVFQIFGAVVLLVALAAGGFWGYSWFRKNTVDEADSHPIPAAKIDFNSMQQRVADFYNYGSDFEDEADFLLASYAFQRVGELGAPHLALLMEVPEEAAAVAWEQERDSIAKTMAKAEVRHEKVLSNLKPQNVNVRDLDLARTEIRREEFKEASLRLRNILSANPANERARDLMGQAQERLAFLKLKEGDLSSASTHFERAAVLLLGYDMNRRHLNVIKCYFNGTIREGEKNQWFFFFE